MNPLPPKNREYVVNALVGAPAVLKFLLKDLSRGDARWDVRVDPDRFTLREVLAHWADFDPIFLNRIMRTFSEDDPSLPDYDEGQLAIDHDYSHKDPWESFALLQTSRVELVNLIEGLPVEAWTRIGHKDGAEWQLQEWIVHVLAHDGYHLQQTAEWLKRIS